VLDILSSDYVPGSLLIAALQLPDVASGFTLPAAFATVSKTPAEAVGLTDRGEIAVGKRADVVRVRAHDLPASGRHPRGLRVPVVRGVYRQGARVA
jgi:alpha-D-ribose 1-methylphosphonate 5-triphosphate diphosphatase